MHVDGVLAGHHLPNGGKLLIFTEYLSLLKFQNIFKPKPLNARKLLIFKLNQIVLFTPFL